MHRDEKVGLVAVSDVGPFDQRHEHIGGAGVDDLDIGAVPFHEFAKSQRHFQVNVLLLGDGPRGPRVVASMPGIDDEREFSGCQGWDDGEQAYDEDK